MANAFESDLSSTFKAYNYHWHKLAVPANPNIRFLHKPPYDYYVVNKNAFYAIEAKMNAKEVTSFPFDRIDDHQLEALLKVTEEGFKAYIFINFRKPKNKAYAIEVRDFVVLRDTIGRKSIPLSMFDSDDRFISIPRGKLDDKLVWLVGDILNGEKSNENS